MKKIGIFKDLGYVFVVIYISLSLVLIIFHNPLKNISECIPNLVIFMIFFALLMHVIYAFIRYFIPMLNSGELKERYERSLKGLIPFKLYYFYAIFISVMVLICTIILNIWSGIDVIYCFIKGKELTHNTKKCISLIETKYSMEGRQNAKVGRCQRNL